jgi:ABC-2 type transport system permease protein
MDAHMPTNSLADTLLTTRRSIMAPVLAVAKMQAYYCISQIRTSILIAWLTTLVEMLVARQLWIALFNGQVIYEGFTLDQTLTYIVLSMIIYNMLKGDGIQYIYWKIRSGNILFDLMYPLRFPIYLMVFALSSLILAILTTAIPLLGMAVILLKIPLPATLEAWLAFGVSFLLGCLIFHLIDTLASLLGFWTTETHGLLTWKEILVALLSGAFFPLWIFPDIIERVIAWLPFRSIQYVPLSIWVGWIGPRQYLRDMAIQIGWVLILWLAVEGLFKLVERKLEIQGG